MEILTEMKQYANTNVLIKLYNVLIKLYYAIVYRFLIYGLFALGSTYPTTLKSIVVFQKKTVRIITSSKYDAHTSLPFYQLSVLMRILKKLITIKFLN